MSIVFRVLCASCSYGTEEDSLGSVYNLVPKQPKKDWGKLTAFDKKKMLIAATLVRALAVGLWSLLLLRFMVCTVSSVVHFCLNSRINGVLLFGVHSLV